MNDYLGLSRFQKRDFFDLFLPSWEAAFSASNINSGWRTTGLHPFNPDIILKRFEKKIENRPSSSESSQSILKVEDWRRIRKLLQDVVDDIYDRRAQKLTNSIINLSTENSLLKHRCEGLQ
jgi:hypothetical protein